MTTRTGKDITVRKGFFRFRGVNVRKYQLRDASYSLSNEFSRWLTAGNDEVTIRTDLHRIRKSLVEHRLKGLRSDRISELNVHRSKDIFTSRMRRELSDLDEMILRSSKGTAMFDLKMTVSISSSHPADVSRKSLRFERAMGLLGLAFKPVENYSQRKLSSRLLENRSGKRYLMDSGSIASFLPVFLTTSKNMTGVYLGTEASTGMPLFLNQFENPSYNINVIGETGSGKSFFSKMLALRSLQEGLIDWLIVIDPLSEYEKVFPDACSVNLSNGEYFDHSNLTGMERQENEMIRFLCDLAGLDDDQSAVVRMASQKAAVNGNETELLDAIIKELTDSSIVTKLMNLRSRYFKKRKQLDPSKQKTLIIQTPADLGRERGQLLLTATVTARTMCSVLPGRKMVLIDEMHLFMSERTSSQYISNFFRNSRHYETSIVGMTQNMYDLESSEFAETISDNSIALIVFRTKSIGKGSRFIDLEEYGSPAPEILVGGKRYDYSECLMLYRRRLKKLKIFATREELSLIDLPDSSASPSHQLEQL